MQLKLVENKNDSLKKKVRHFQTLIKIQANERES